MLTARRLHGNRREIIGVRSSIYCKKEKRHLFDVVFGDPSENRTPDTMIKSHVLCQLS